MRARPVGRAYKTTGRRPASGAPQFSPSRSGCRLCSVVQKIDPVTQSVCQLFHGPRPALTPPTALDPAPPLPFNHKYRVLAPGGYMYSTVLNQSLATIEKFDDPPNINQRDQVYIRIRPAPATPFSVSGLRGACGGVKPFRARNQRTGIWRLDEIGPCNMFTSP